MKKIVITLCCFFVLLKTSNAQQFDKIKAIQLSDSIYYWMIGEEYGKVYQLFSDDMKRQLDSSLLQDSWDGLLMQFGKVISKGNPLYEEEQFYMVKLPILFEKLNMQFVITFDSNYQVIGYFISPLNQEYRVPNYVQTLNFLEYKIKFGKEPYILDGVLSIPKNGNKIYPLVIIVHGSGPSDKDGSIGPNKMYKDIAWGLASNGIAVFRYEKRTKTYGIMMMGNKDAERMTVEQETVEDALMAIEKLTTNKFIDRSKIYILGHSQGGMLAPLIASKSKKLSGIIMVAANARPLQELLIEQVEYVYKLQANNSSSREKVDMIIRQAKNAMPNKLNQSMSNDSLPFGTYPIYWEYLNNYNQVKVAQKLKNKRMLILQGERDYQVTTQDFNIWQRNLGSVNTEFISYPKLNHQMMKGEGVPNPDEYQKPSNVDETVIMNIRNWLISK
jgi:predicted peptidase